LFDNLNFILLPLSLFDSTKRETEKPLATASSPMAIGFPPYVHCVPKNPKLAMLKQMDFFNVTPFTSVGSADVAKKEKW